MIKELVVNPSTITPSDPDQQSQYPVNGNMITGVTVGDKDSALRAVQAALVTGGAIPLDAVKRALLGGYNGQTYQVMEKSVVANMENAGLPQTSSLVEAVGKFGAWQVISEVPQISAGGEALPEVQAAQLALRSQTLAQLEEQRALNKTGESCPQTRIEVLVIIGQDGKITYLSDGDDKKELNG